MLKNKAFFIVLLTSYLTIGTSMAAQGKALQREAPNEGWKKNLLLLPQNF